MLVYQEARERARAVLDAIGPDSARVDLDDVCDMFDLDVYFTDRMPDGISGMIVKDDDDESAAIFINSTHNERRQRFTLAHEIGHYVERVVVSGDQEFSFEDHRGQKYDLHEFFADEFAGALLMPEREFSSDVANGVSDTELAAKYGVSVPAVESRRSRLKKQPTLDSARG